MKGIIYFTLGAITGAISTYIYVTKKVNKEFNEGLEKVREFYREKEDISTEEKAFEDKPVEDSPHPIPPEEFGELDDYDTVTLMYEDGIVMKKNGAVVKNAERLIGNNFADLIGQYEEGSAYIRNDELKTDYEIVSSVGLFDRRYDE